MELTLAILIRADFVTALKKLSCVVLPEYQDVRSMSDMLEIIRVCTESLKEAQKRIFSELAVSTHEVPDAVAEKLYGELAAMRDGDAEGRKRFLAVMHSSVVKRIPDGKAQEFFTRCEALCQQRVKLLPRPLRLPANISPNPFSAHELSILRPLIEL